MRLVLFGTSSYAVPHLERVAAAGHSVLRCITQPDQPQGRGLRPQPSPVKSAARRLRIPVEEPGELAALAAGVEPPDLGVVISFGRLIPRVLLEWPRHGMLGVHPSLLPRYRGASPMVWPLLNGETQTGVTIFRLNERMDAGDILLQRAEPIAPRDTIESLSGRLAALGAELLTEGLAALELGAAVFQPQDETLATSTTKLTKAYGRIDWTQEAMMIDRKVRALNPWPGTFTVCDGQPLRLWSTDVRTPSASKAPGTVSQASPEGLVVATGGGALIIRELQRAGGRRMTVREFLAGHPMAAGARLGEGA